MIMSFVYDAHKRKKKKEEKSTTKLNAILIRKHLERVMWRNHVLKTIPAVYNTLFKHQNMQLNKLL